MAKNDSFIVQTKDLYKTFFTKKGGDSVEAVKGVDLNVKKGEIFGFLGPNGAGKTTTLNMLTTLLKPTSGEAWVAGYDLLKEPHKIRQYIGYVSQVGGVDTSTNAYENLILQARLCGVSASTAASRARELVKQFQMSEFADRKVTLYSGGQKRRLDLALGVVNKPQLIFLDEPTLGLDPQSRAHFRDEIRKIRADDTTIFLTTHYLDEADELCDTLAIVDHGVIVATGTPDELKRNIGGESIILVFKSGKDLEKGEKIIEKQSYGGKLCVSENKLYIYVKDGEKLLVEVLRFLDRQGVSVMTIELSKPSLDDVFLQKTGRSLREGGES
jgi:ABC-2 type transport system ATP-binding protein